MNQLLFNKLLNQITEEEKNQLSDKQKKALKALIGSKPSVPFSSATLHDCVRPDGLALNIDYVSIYTTSLHIPTSFPTPVASDTLFENLRRIMSSWILQNDKSGRIVIDAILTELLWTKGYGSLFGFCEVKNDWEGTGFGYTGNVDYIIGSSKTKSVDNIEPMILVSVAKQEWPQSAIPQVLCEAGCLLKKRLSAGINTPVFAVLTNGFLFRFFAIDTDGVVYASKHLILEVGEDATYNSSSSLSEILRWFTWLITSIQSISPRSSCEDFAAEKIEDSITQLRNCFGPKNQISRKKVKINN